MDKRIVIFLIFVACTRCQDPRPISTTPYLSDNNVEELFLREFLDKIKPFINTIIEEWKHDGSSENMPGGFIEQLVEAYARRFRPHSPSLPPDAIDSFLKHVQEFKACIDQTLARSAGLRQKRSIFRGFGNIGDKYSQKFTTVSSTTEGSPVPSNPA